MNHLKKEKLTQKRLKELLHYDPDTGIFRWKITKSNVWRGTISGSKNYYGYIHTGIDGKLYKNHRLSWLYYYGYFPEGDIDHINRIKTDNRIDNLREVGKQCNARNCGNRADNTSGVKGVHWDKKHKKWYVQIMVNQKRKYLGCYKNFDEAVCARLSGEQCLNWSGCNSSSPAFQYVQKMLKLTKKKLPRIIVK